MAKKTATVFECFSWYIMFDGFLEEKTTEIKKGGGVVVLKKTRSLIRMTRSGLPTQFELRLILFQKSTFLKTSGWQGKRWDINQN